MSPGPAPSPLVAVAFCPHPPSLLPTSGGAPAPATGTLRSACEEALHTVLTAGPDVVLVVGDGPAGVRYGAGDSADLAPWGGEGRVAFAGRVRPGGRPLPLGHAVAAGLLDRAGHAGTRLGVAPDDLATALSDLPGPVVVLAMGDGSPAAVARALAAGDPAALAAPAAREAGRGPATGADTWQAVGRVLTGRPVTARLLHGSVDVEDGHLVADWLVAPVPDRIPGWVTR